MKRHAPLKFAVGLVVVALGMWGADIWQDRQIQLEVIGSTELLSLPPSEYPESNPPVRTLAVGEEVRVLRMRYGKDFQAFRIETQDGAEGWVIRGDTIRVKSGA